MGKQCVDGTTLPSPGMMVTGVCPGSVSAEQQAKLNSEVAAMLAEEKPAGKDRSLQDSTGPVAQCSSWKSIGFIKGGLPFSKGVFCQVGIGAAAGNEWKQCVDGTTLDVSPGEMVTGVCPGSISAEELAKLNSEVAPLIAE